MCKFNNYYQELKLICINFFVILTKKCSTLDVI